MPSERTSKGKVFPEPSRQQPQRAAKETELRKQTTRRAQREAAGATGGMTDKNPATSKGPTTSQVTEMDEERRKEREEIDAMRAELKSLREQLQATRAAAVAAQAPNSLNGRTSYERLPLNNQEGVRGETPTWTETSGIGSGEWRERARVPFREEADMLPKYSGEDTTLRVERWVTVVEEQARLSGWDDYQTLIAGKRALTEAAKDWSECLQGVSTWTNFRVQIVDTFKCQVNEGLVIETLLKSRPERDETWLRYVYCMRRLGQQGGISETLIIRYIINGLPRDARMKVSLYACRDFHEITNQLEAYGTAYEESKKTQGTQGTAQSKPTSALLNSQKERSIARRSASTAAARVVASHDCWHADVSVRSEAHTWALGYFLGNTSGVLFSGSSALRDRRAECFPGPVLGSSAVEQYATYIYNTVQIAKINHPRINYSTKDILNKGHKGRDCPEKAQGPKCYACQESGHIATYCPNKSSRERNRESVNQVRDDATKTLESKVHASVEVNGIWIRALLDTGSQYNIIQEDVWDQILDENRTLLFEVFEHSGMLRGFGGRRVKPSCRVKLVAFIDRSTAVEPGALIARRLQGYGDVGAEGPAAEDRSKTPENPRETQEDQKKARGGKETNETRDDQEPNETRRGEKTRAHGKARTRARDNARSRVRCSEKVESPESHQPTKSERPKDDKPREQHKRRETQQMPASLGKVNRPAQRRWDLQIAEEVKASNDLENQGEAARSTEEDDTETIGTTEAIQTTKEIRATEEIRMTEAIRATEAIQRRMIQAKQKES
ncbi:hypothetical protein TSAR_009037 [Trichomalopsis sarcophagae]|uniref:CCHC-type domain-containing protein n=1 Tax=Trichomalopsis sarcophagae TaxID=543379 RepID=A0A232ED36_9HYME|nr:hypothetical protein TSAR_009037 [Trichomalopsis sarcophagae]